MAFAIARLLRAALADPRARGLDLESAAATETHARLIRAKGLLGAVYRDYYGQLAAGARRAPPGARVEIGAGGGFLGELVPGVVTLDLRPGARVDLQASALDLPFRDETVGAVLALNVLHHLPDLERFFDELERALVPGGRLVAVEPWVSPLSRRIYRHLHHEPFDPEVEDWRLPDAGPMTAANGALPWVALVRDRARFERRFDRLVVERVAPHTVARYLLSGGLSMRALAPGGLARPLARAEALLGPALPRLASMMTVEVRRA